MPLICVVTPLYPLPDDTYRGRPIYETIRALRRYADVEVICPLASYPRWSPTSRVGLPPNCAGDDREPPVTYFQYPAFPLMSRPVNGRICAAHLEPLLAKVNPDVVLNFWLYPEGYASVLSAHRLGIPAIVFSRGSDLRRIQDPITRMLVSKTVQEADYVLTVSKELGQHAATLGARPDRTRTILNGCDRAVFRYEDRSFARKSLNINQDDEIVLYVGRLAPAKGIIDLNAAFAVLNKETPRRRLVYLGTGPLYDEIKQWSGSLSGQDRLLMPGAQTPEQVARWMQAADVCCLPSYSEGCPNVVIEATACGCPVVGTEVGGLPEIVRPETGLLTQPGDPGQLAETLRLALGRKWDRKRISALFRRTWDDVAAETFDVCQAVASPRPRRLAPKRRRSPMKITLVTSYFPTSAESYRGHSALHTVLALQKLADVEVVCPLTTYPQSRLFGRKAFDTPDLDYCPPGIETRYVPYSAIPGLTRPINAALCEFAALPHVRASKPDVLLNYWLYPEGLAAIRMGRRLKVPVVVGSIGSDIRRIQDPITRALTRQALALADGVITVSEDLRRHAIGLGAPPARVQTILNGCDTGVFHPRDRDEARRRLGCEPDAELVLFVGTLLVSKGLAELAEAFKQLAAARPAARLALVGEGAFASQLSLRLAKAGVSERVRFLGRQPSAVVADWMCAADVFCLPSHSEGCPNVVVEALACGRPVVATRVGGIPELVTDQCGILVPPRAPEALRAALDRALTQRWDPTAIARAFQRGWAAVAADTYAVCCRIVEEARRANGRAMAMVNSI